MKLPLLFTCACRSFNARQEDETMREQFGKLAQVRPSDGLRVIFADDIKAAIGLSQPWFDETLKLLSGHDARGELRFDDLVEFLEFGTLPEPVVASEVQPVTAAAQRKTTEVLPPPSPLQTQRSVGEHLRLSSGEHSVAPAAITRRVVKGSTLQYLAAQTP